MHPVDPIPPALSAWQTNLTFVRAEPLPQVTNPVWLVVTEDDRRFVLKELPEFPPGVGPVDEFRVLSHLAATNIPVALPVITDDARLWSMMGDRKYMLLPWIDHDDRNHELGVDAAVTARAIGHALGSLDAALAACPWRPPSFVDDPARQVLGETVPQLPELRELVAPLMDRLWSATHDLPSQLTHGDCNTGNVLVRGSEVVAFLDIDHLPVGPRVRDLSYYLSSRLRSHLADVVTAEHNVQAWMAVLADYIAGYHEAHPLSVREIDAIVPLILVIEIGVTAWCVQGWVPDPAGYRRGLRTASWLTTHLDDVTAAATRTALSPSGTHVDEAGRGSSAGG